MQNSFITGKFPSWESQHEELEITFKNMCTTMETIQTHDRPIKMSQKIES